MNIATDSDNSATLEIKAGEIQGGARSETSRMPCEFRGVQGNRLTLGVSQRIAPFTTLSVEYDDVLFLGEVVACTQDYADRWSVEIAIEQMLNGLQSLVTLRSRLLGESVPTPQSHPAVASR